MIIYKCRVHLHFLTPSHSQVGPRSVGSGSFALVTYSTHASEPYRVYRLAKVEFIDLQKFQNPIKSIYWEFENYLKERKQFTSIKDVNSSLNDILCGVPQGSILGPILFLILKTDLPNASKLFIILFVDDTTLQFSSEKLKSIYDFAHVELSKVADWFKANKLTLNAYKTKYILFRKKIKVLVGESRKLYIENKEINRIGAGCKNESFKFVGIHLDENLTWNHHVKAVKNQIKFKNLQVT